LRPNNGLAKEIVMTVEKRSDTLTCEILSDICFDSPQDISLSNVMVGRVSIVDESDNGSGLVFIERGPPGQRPRFLCSFAADFFDVRCFKSECSVSTKS
jgi:hypothetical protein